jgi:hypothetical protein
VSSRSLTRDVHYRNDTNVLIRGKREDLSIDVFTFEVESFSHMGVPVGCIAAGQPVSSAASRLGWSSGCAS